MNRAVGLGLVCLLFVLSQSVSAQVPGVWGKARTGFKSDGGFVLANAVSAKDLAVSNPAIAKKYPAAKYRYFAIDIDQDGAMDVIAEHKTALLTCFVKSNLAIENCERFNFSTADGFAYELFVSRGKNVPAALLDLSGDTDSSQYFLKSFDAKTWKLKSIIRLFPVVDSNTAKRKGLYWGYPWDLRSLPVQVSGTAVQVQATFDHKLDQDLQENDPVKGPALLFKGEASQGSSTGPHEALRPKFKWVDLDQLK